MKDSHSCFSPENLSVGRGSNVIFVLLENSLRNTGKSYNLNIKLVAQVVLISVTLPELMFTTERVPIRVLGSSTKLLQDSGVCPFQFTERRGVMEVSRASTWK